MTFTLKKLITGIAAVVGFISLFLPWYAASIFGTSMSVNAFGGDYVWVAIINIIAIVMLLALNCLPEKTLKGINKSLVEKSGMLTKVFAVIILAVSFLAMIMYTSSSFGMGSMGFGFWLMIIAGAAVLIANLMKNKELDKVVVGDSKKK